MSIGVALANKRGIAIACDSAVTASVKAYGRPDEEYCLKSGNKLFRLSKKYPIGATVTSQSTINSVELDNIFFDLSKKYDESGFYDDFFDCFDGFLENMDQNREKYHFDKYLSDEFIDLSYRTICGLNDALDNQKEDDNILGYTIDEIERKTRKIDKQYENFDFLALLKGHTYERFLKCLSEQCHYGLPEEFVEDLFTFLGTYFFHSLFYKSITKILLIGYGKEDILPKAIEFKYYGYWYGHQLYKIAEKSEFYKYDESIYFHNGYTEGAEILSQGFNTDAIKDFNNENLIPDTTDLFSDLLTEEQQEIFKDKVDSDFFDNFEEVLLDNLDHIKDDFFKNLTALNVLDLANIAEGLVKAECLRHKYFTDKSYQRVAEPIDVAIITRKGFKWIKNKNLESEEL